MSATWTVTSCSTRMLLGTSSVEPVVITTRGGMLLMARNSASLMPVRLAASAGFMVDGAIQTVQLARRPLFCASRLRWNTAALSHGSKICGVPAARMTGRLTDGFRALKSSSDTSASLAASATSMSRLMLTVWKNGWFSISGSRALKASGAVTMFLTACSLGT